MRKLALVVVVTASLIGCSSQSAEDKAVEEAVKAVQEVLGTVDPSSVVEIDEATAKQWPDKFCSLEVDMTRDEVQAIMGTPTMTYRDQNFNQDQYEAWGYGLTIFYDVDDKANQLQSNYENVPCETKSRP